MSGPAWIDVAPQDWRPGGGHAAPDGWLRVKVVGARWTGEPGWVQVDHYDEWRTDAGAPLVRTVVRLSALPEEARRMLPYQPNPVLESADHISVAVVGYRDEDGGEPVQRVDLIDARTLETLASLTRGDAYLLADRIRLAASNPAPALERQLLDIDAINDRR